MRLKRMWCVLWRGHDWILEGTFEGRGYVCGWCGARPRPFSLPAPPPPGWGPGERR